MGGVHRWVVWSGGGRRCLVRGGGQGCKYSLSDQTTAPDMLRYGGRYASYSFVNIFAA